MYEQENGLEGISLGETGPGGTLGTILVEPRKGLIRLKDDLKLSQRSIMEEVY